MSGVVMVFPCALEKVIFLVRWNVEHEQINQSSEEFPHFVFVPSLRFITLSLNTYHMISFEYLNSYLLKFHIVYVCVC